MEGRLDERQIDQMALATRPEGTLGGVPMTAQEARELAEAEGLTLLTSDTHISGFHGIWTDARSINTPYQAKVLRDGKRVHLGSYRTAEEAALVFARSPEGRAAAAAAAAAPPTMTADGALQLADEEGLTLLRAETATGFQGVHFISRSKATPYQAMVRRDGKNVSLGHYATAEEAALVVARTPEGKEAAAAAAAAAAAPPTMTAAGALQLADEEGLTLLRSETASGFQGVHVISRSKATPYQAMVWRNGKNISLGEYATAEEAALVFARTPEGKEAAAAAAAALEDTVEGPDYAPVPLETEQMSTHCEADGVMLLPLESGAPASDEVHRCSDSEQCAPEYNEVRIKMGGEGAAASPQNQDVATWPGYTAFPPVFNAVQMSASIMSPKPATSKPMSAKVTNALAKPLTAAEAWQKAEEEELTLLPSEHSATGFQGVHINTSCASRPYQARLRRGGKQVHLGLYATAEEAALAYARSLAGRPNAPPSATAPLAAPPAALAAGAEVYLQANAEGGLTLMPSNGAVPGDQAVTMMVRVDPSLLASGAVQAPSEDMQGLSALVAAGALVQQSNGAAAAQPHPNSRKHKRVPFSPEEEEYVVRGYEEFEGEKFTWKSIRDKYPFHPTRTSIDIKDKWRNIQKKRLTATQKAHHAARVMAADPRGRQILAGLQAEQHLAGVSRWTATSLVSVASPPAGVPVYGEAAPMEEEDGTELASGQGDEPDMDVEGEEAELDGQALSPSPSPADGGAPSTPSEIGSVGAPWHGGLPTGFGMPEGGGSNAVALPSSLSANHRWRIPSFSIAVLERVYQLDPYPSLKLKNGLADNLNVSPRQIQVWFQNRRQKDRKEERKEDAEGAAAASAPAAGLHPTIASGQVVEVPMPAEAPGSYDESACAAAEDATSQPGLAMLRHDATASLSSFDTPQPSPADEEVRNLLASAPDAAPAPDLGWNPLEAAPAATALVETPQPPPQQQQQQQPQWPAPQAQQQPQQPQQPQPPQPPQQLQTSLPQPPPQPPQQWQPQQMLQPPMQQQQQQQMMMMMQPPPQQQQQMMQPSRPPPQQQMMQPSPPQQPQQPQMSLQELQQLSPQDQLQILARTQHHSVLRQSAAQLAASAVLAQRQREQQEQEKQLLLKQQLQQLQQRVFSQEPLKAASSTALAESLLLQSRPQQPLQPPPQPQMQTASALSLADSLRQGPAPGRDEKGWPSKAMWQQLYEIQEQKKTQEEKEMKQVQQQFEQQFKQRQHVLQMRQMQVQMQQMQQQLHRMQGAPNFDPFGRPNF